MVPKILPQESEIHVELSSSYAGSRLDTRLLKLEFNLINGTQQHQKPRLVKYELKSNIRDMFF